MENSDIQLVLNEVATIKTQIAEMHSELIKIIESSVPNGDLQAHRAYHESLTEKNRARTEFYRKLIFELAKWGIIGALSWATVVFFKGLK
jgi:hypothetical protein